MFPTTVANAMFRASTVGYNYIMENITRAIDEIYKEILYDEEKIMQGMKLLASPWKNPYHAAFVNGKNN